jgi:hypothetical protein
MEIPTTSNLKSLQAFHEVFLDHIRPVAEHDRIDLTHEEKQKTEELRGKFIPASIVMDTVSYMKYHLSEFAADEVLKMGTHARDSEEMIERCDELDPYFKATRALALALHVFATEASETFTTVDTEQDEED